MHKRHLSDVQSIHQDATKHQKSLMLRAEHACVQFIQMLQLLQLQLVLQSSTCSRSAAWRIYKHLQTCLDVSVFMGSCEAAYGIHDVDFCVVTSWKCLLLPGLRADNNVGQHVLTFLGHKLAHSRVQAQQLQHKLSSLFWHSCMGRHSRLWFGTALARTLIRT